MKKVNNILSIDLKQPIWRILALLLLFIGLLVTGCKKSDELAPDPYGKTVEPLVKFLDQDPSPISGTAGEKVTFYIRGLANTDISSFQFYINQIKAEVISVKDSAVTVIIPDKASSGAASILVKGENYFGPIFQVDGYVRIDPTFDAGKGVAQFQSIKDLIPIPDGGYYLVGNFNNFSSNATEAAPINGIVKIDAKGKFVPLKDAGKAVEGGSINSIITIKGSDDFDYYYIGGSFSGYNVRDGIHNITRLKETAALDTTTVTLINLDPDIRPEDSFDTVSVFNGGVNGPISYLFNDGKGIVAIGAFQNYYSYFYDRSTVGNLLQDRYKIGQFLRMHEDGSLDSTYNFDPNTGYGNSGTNGFIYGATQLQNNRIIIVGSFNKFNGAAVGRIAMLSEDGLMDPTFNAGGTGANGEINSINYNKNTHKIMITGAFTSYNGKSAKGVAMLNEDGTLDDSFTFGETGGGAPNYAAQLSNGLVLVSGYFDHYNGTFRQGLIFLNQDGTLAQGYNNMGSFGGGPIYKIYEAPTDLGTFGVILIGSFNQVDNQPRNGIVKLEIQ